jgi:hypothetical protein
MEPKRKATIDPSLAFYLARCTVTTRSNFSLLRLTCEWNRTRRAELRGLIATSNMKHEDRTGASKASMVDGPPNPSHQEIDFTAHPFAGRMYSIAMSGQYPFERTIQ